MTELVDYGLVTKTIMWQEYEKEDALLLYDVLLHRNLYTPSLFFESDTFFYTESDHQKNGEGSKPKRHTLPQACTGRAA